MRYDDVIGTREDDVGDFRGRGIILLDMVDDLVARIGKSAVDEVEVKITVFGVTPFNDDGVTVAISCSQEVDFVWQSTLL